MAEDIKPTLGLSPFDQHPVTVRLVDAFSTMQPGESVTHAEISDIARTSKDAWQPRMETVKSVVLRKTQKVVLSDPGIGYKIATDSDLAAIAESTRKSVHTKATKGCHKASLANVTNLPKDAQRRMEANVQTLGVTIMATAPKTMRRIESSKLANKALAAEDVIEQLRLLNSGK